MAHYAVHAPFETDKRFVDHYTDPSKSLQARAFATLIEGMDKSLGDIMDHLEELGVAENTLILFLGDNGSDAPLGDEKGHCSSAPLRGKKEVNMKEECVCRLLPVGQNLTEEILCRGSCRSKQGGFSSS